MTAVLRAVGLTVTYGTSVVLDDVDVEVGGGRWTTIVGPNGAGKTSLLRAIVGGVGHTGRVEFDGVVDLSVRARSRTVALVPQIPVIPPGMTVVDYVMLGRTPHRGVFAAESRRDRRVVGDVLNRLDLVRFADRAVASLSGGERQRVVLARALAQEARLLLLDEPTSALDLGHQQDVLELIDELRHESGIAILATQHDLTLAGRYGDHLVMLSNGTVVAAGSAREVLTEANISEHFGAKVMVIDDDAGPIVVPVVPTSTS